MNLSVADELIAADFINHTGAISEWREANSVWQQRASVVAFANLAREGDQNFPGFTEMVLDNCTHLLESQERFAQTGVGWILRELSHWDQGCVIGFVKANLVTSPERL